MQFFLLSLCVSAVTVKVSPIEKVLQLLGDLQGKIINDGEEQQKLYEEFADYCKDSSKELQFSIQTGNSDAERHAAAQDESTAEISELETKIDRLSSAVASNSADLAAATKIRETEAADFAAADADLAETVNMLGRAIAIIEKEMRGGSALLQSGSVVKVTSALMTLVNAASVNTLDKAKVQSLIQSQEDDLQPAGAPAPDAYENKSGGILSTLEDMLEKAQAQQADGQKAEMNAKHNFQMLKQGLEDAVATQNKDLADAKKGKAAATERNAGAEGDLGRTNKAIAGDKASLKDLRHECMTRAEEYETEQHERSSELDALAAAKKILEEKTGAAADRTYSFVQVRATTSARDSATTQAVALLRRLAKENGTLELAQLAMRLRSAVATSADPFGKVKGMIQEMIEKLVAEAQEEAGKKAFCDKEMSETKAKKEDKSGEVDDLNTKIDTAAAKIAKLAEEVSTLEGEVQKLSEENRLATSMREEEKAAWTQAKSDFEQGLEGVQMALQVLRDYYAEKDEGATALLQASDMSTQMAAASKSSGAAGGIIGMLEVAESDFSKMLAEGTAGEDQAQKQYDTVSQDTKVALAEKRTAITYAGKDSKETQAFLEDTKSDLGTSQTELDAILEYWSKLQPQCIAKPEPYEERKKRREKEIAGLKEALEILAAEGGEAFLQKRA